MKKSVKTLTALAMMLCAVGLNAAGKKNSWKNKSAVSVLSREDGSGTRGAFIELFGIEKKNSEGKKVDFTTDEAVITNSTAVMMTSVSRDKYAIGYISLGSLNNSVKAVKIDGAAATVENITAGKYKIARPFNIAVTDKASDAAKDFIGWIMGDDGQAVVGANGYIKVSSGKFVSAQPEGKIVVAGSSSVSPVMEKLIEAYRKVNPNVTIEMQTSDSTTGMTSAADGLCDIGMASRDLKESEINKGLKNTVIAMDGIAVIVNLENPVENLTSADVEKIFTGETTTWRNIVK